MRGSCGSTKESRSQSGVKFGYWKRFFFYCVFGAPPSRLRWTVLHGLSVRRCSSNGEDAVYFFLFVVGSASLRIWRFCFRIASIEVFVSNFGRFVAGSPLHGVRRSVAGLESRSSLFWWQRMPGILIPETKFRIVPDCLSLGGVVWFFFLCVGLTASSDFWKFFLLNKARSVLGGLP